MARSTTLDEKKVLLPQQLQYSRFIGAWGHDFSLGRHALVYQGYCTYDLSTTIAKEFKPKANNLQPPLVTYSKKSKINIIKSRNSKKTA